MSSQGGSQLRIVDFRDLSSIDPARFRKARNFSVEIVPRIGGAGTVLRLKDASLGIVIDFPWWDAPERDISEWESGYVPLGTCEEPYFEEDQCWRLLIWRMNDVVYIASGNDDEEALYDTFLSVPIKIYSRAWAELLVRHGATDLSAGD